MESSKNNLQTEDQIDIIALLSKVWYHKKSILKTVVIFGVIGIIVACRRPISIPLLPCLPQITVGNLGDHLG